jgi:thiol:disulfide interchange protein
MKIRGYVALSSMFLIGSATAADVWSKKSVAGPDLLPADTAFQLVSAQRDGDNVKLDWVIAPGYYLYRKRLSFEPVQPAQAHLGAAQLPKGENVHDEHFGDTEIYRETLQAKLPLTKGAPAVQQLRVRYQGCADAGVCYPPVTRVIDVAAAPR